MKGYLALFAVLLSVSTAAQQPTAPKPTAPAPKQPAPVEVVPILPQSARSDPSAGGQPINVRVEISVIDESGAGVLQPKIMALTLVDRALAQSRAMFEDRSFNMDARPTIVDGRIRLYLAIVSNRQGQGDRTLEWSNSFALLLQNGQPMIAVETTDPATKRKMSIEVKATIQK